MAEDAQSIKSLNSAADLAERQLARAVQWRRAQAIKATRLSWLRYYKPLS